jgi:sugar-specific transcriptional regulator TrmB
MDDPYLNDLKSEFREYSSELKILKKNLLKSNSPEEQAIIIKKIDSIARDMEKNQRQSVRVTKSRLKEKSKSNKTSKF